MTLDEFRKDAKDPSSYVRLTYAQLTALGDRIREAALEEAARAVELIEAQCEAEDIDSPELPVVAAAIRALKGAQR